MKKILIFTLILSAIQNSWAMEENDSKTEISDSSSSAATLTELMRQYMIYFPERVDGAIVWDEIKKVRKAPKYSEVLSWTEDIISVDSKVNNPIYNYVFSGNLDISNDKVSSIVNYYNTVQRPYIWYLIESKNSEGLEKKLIKRELVHAASFVAMTIDIQKCIPQENEANLALKRVLTRTDVNDFESIAQTNSELPDTVKEYYSKFDVSKIDKNDLVRGYVGLIKNKPIVTGIIALQDTKDDSNKTAYLDAIKVLKQSDDDVEKTETLSMDMLINLLNIARLNNCAKAIIEIDSTKQALIEKLENMGFVIDQKLKLYMPNQLISK